MKTIKMKMNTSISWALSALLLKKVKCTCIFVLDDMNSDISDDGSLFGRHLNQFCVNNKLVLTSKVMLPSNSYTYISEAWHTTSWLDHCICTADAHDHLMETEILYSLATTDHISLSMILDLDSLPEVSSYETHEQRKVDWARLTEYDVWKYNSLTDRSLSNIDIPIDAILCNNINCKNNEQKKKFKLLG